MKNRSGGTLRFLIARSAFSLLRFNAFLLLFAAGTALGTIRYVDVNCATPSVPYTSWSTAATTIQDAIDAASAGDQIIVTNGVYANGGAVVFGSLTNRVAINKAVSVVSANGPLYTVIQGYAMPVSFFGDSAVRGVYVAPGASISGFTITNGATRNAGSTSAEQSGAGVWCAGSSAIVSNCVIVGNFAPYYGGGAFGGTLYNCVLYNNSATNGGAGTCSNLVINCSIASNRSLFGAGGAVGATLRNSIVYFNIGSPANHLSCSFTNSDATPLPGGLGNIGVDPVFADLVHGNLRLLSNSPCIDVGLNSVAPLGSDLDGNARIYNGTVDMGAYEFQGVAAPLAPYITVQPASQSVFVGTNVTFSVSAGGSAPLTYRWNSNAVPLASATNASLTFSNVQLSQSGAAYSVLVSNSFGTVLSTNAILTVTTNSNVAPFITGQPTNQTVVAGSTAILAVTAGGSAPLKYQWRFIGTNLPGATTNPIVFSNVQLSRAGNYSVLITNSFGAILSSNATLNVIAQDPSFVTQPSSKTVPVGTDVTLTASAAGTAPLIYQWRFNGSPIIDATNTSFSLLSVQTNQSGNYSVMVSNSVGTAVSSDAVLTVLITGTRYVDANNANPSAPYTTWATAAKTIQDAIDVAWDGDEIIVTNGLYASGGRAVFGSMTNRVAVIRALKVHSVNGPQYTIIDGAANMRCAYLAATASLTGFTLTNGATLMSGDPIREVSGGGVFAESLSSKVTNCIITYCSAWNVGGGCYSGTYYGSTVVFNSAYYGAGGTSNVFNNCIINTNWASYNGAGALSSTLNNCLLRGNSGSYGGGAYSCILANCTLTDNTGWSGGGGAYASTLYNCISYFNRDGQNYANCSLYYCCTTPQPSGGTNNLVANPQFIDYPNGNLRLATNSPCIDAGQNFYAVGSTDLDGNTRTNGWSADIGAYEYQGPPTPPVILTQPGSANVLVGASVTFSVFAGGSRPLGYQWRLEGSAIAGATNTALNLSNVQHSQAGNYSVIVSNIAGTITSANALLTVDDPPLPTVRYVNLNNPNPSAPYTNWATAAVTIQDAINVSIDGDQILVTNGTYSAGGNFDSRVNADRAVWIRSVNGPNVTQISGGTGALGTNQVRCISLVGTGLLSGFTLSGGVLPYGNSGGGVFCNSQNATVSNCVIVGNSATYGAGVYLGTVYDCVLAGNTSDGWGGGAESSILFNCLLVTNVANTGGGAAYCSLYNCTVAGNFAATAGGVYAHSNSITANSIIYLNSATNGSNYAGGGFFQNCCTAPAAIGGGNISTDPAFVDPSAGDYHLQFGSPCIDAGNNSYVSGNDLDGNVRIAGGTVDMGAYEFGSSSAGGFRNWLASYGLPTDGSADYADPDGDGMNNWQEWRCGTNPTNAASALRLVSARPIGSTNVTVTWQSTLGVNYFLIRGTNPALPGSFTPLATNIQGQIGTTSYQDTSSIGAPRLYYRVGVGN